MQESLSSTLKIEDYFKDLIINKDEFYDLVPVLVDSFILRNLPLRHAQNH